MSALFVAIIKLQVPHTDLKIGELVVVNKISLGESMYSIEIDGRMPWLVLNSDIEILSEL